MSLEELLRALTGGAGGQEAGKTEGSGFVAGSVGDASDAGRAEAATDAGGLLEALLGGGRPEDATGTQGVPAGIVEGAGMAPGLLQAVLPLILDRLSGARRAASEPSSAQFESGVGGAAAQGLDVDGLLDRMSSEQGLDEDYLRATGMPQELSAKTGIDLPQAISAIKKILELLLGQQAATRKAKSTGSSSSKKRQTTRPRSRASTSRAESSKSSSRSASSRSKAATSRAKKSSTKDADDKPKSTRSKSSSKSSRASTDTKSSRSKSTSRPKRSSSTAKKSTRRSKLSDEVTGGELDGLLEKE